jgi:hypothetical protein
MLMSLMVGTPAWAKTVVKDLSCSQYAFRLKRCAQETYVNRNDILKAGDKIWVKWNGCAITLLVNKQLLRLEYKDANKGKPYKITSKASSPRKSRWEILTSWWSDNLWGEPRDESNAIAATRSGNDNQLTIPLLNPLLKCKQQIVGTGKRLLYLGWSGKDNRSYTVTVKKGRRCKIGHNCWKTTTNQNFTSLEVDLKKGKYEVNVEGDGQSATGYFKVITSPPHFFKSPTTKTQKTGWALELLAHSKSKWMLEAYQHAAAASKSHFKDPARQIRVRLEEGQSISPPQQI